MSTPVTIPKEYVLTATAKQQVYTNTYVLKATSPTPIPFIAGQYASFICPDGRKPFSFANTPSESELEFLIGYTPTGKSRGLIEPLQIGQTLTVLAPYGRFVIDKSDTRPIIFIAGGTGIAPIRSQLRQLQESSSTTRTTLFLAGHDEQRLYYHQEFLALAQVSSLFTYIPCLATPQTPWAGKTGLVTSLVPTTISNMPDFTYYVCGSPSLVTDMIATLKKHGVPESQIHFERFT